VRGQGVPEELPKFDVRVYFNPFPVADYVLNPEIAVERKTVRDLASSVYDSHLFHQTARISALYAKPYLLIKGASTEGHELDGRRAGHDSGDRLEGGRPDQGVA
jgi:DNA excision repair protein ERCC-4